MVWREQVVGPLERQGWLDQVADAVSSAVEPLLRSPAAERGLEVLRGGWLGHPLHPALTGLPLGLWTGSVLLDMVCECKAAGVVSAAGTLSAGAAAAAGFADWTATEGRDRRLADIAAPAGISTAYLSEVERGLKDISTEKLLAVANALQVTVGELYLELSRELGAGEPLNAVAWEADPRAQLRRMSQSLDNDAL